MKKYIQTKYFCELAPITYENIKFFNDNNWPVDIHRHYWNFISRVDIKGRVIGRGSLEKIHSNQI